MLSLLVVMWLVSTNIHTDRPVTLEGVSDEVINGVEMFQKDLPQSAVLDVRDERHVAACPDHGGGLQLSIARTIRTTPTFDRVGWLHTLGARYEKAGWKRRFER
ncbi:hypothetical protein GCM10027052_28590 [Parafrigoribacterium mesophilum]|uniref:hypothetical protein n=1 Tax=Parafrigoribacterium mesophilum TaxID=433646 RepID=UPI0031FD3BAB